METNITYNGIGIHYSVAMSDDGSIVAICCPYTNRIDIKAYNKLFQSGFVREYKWSPIIGNFLERGDNINWIADDNWYESFVVLLDEDSILAIEDRCSSTDNGHNSSQENLSMENCQW